MDAMSRALQKATWSPFSNKIKWAGMPNRFTCPPFNCYDGKTDPVEHVSHYIQMMSLHTHNNALMCKVFPLSLGPTALRWFNGLRKGSIRSFSELIQQFDVRFMTCGRVPQLVDALLSTKMKAGETLRSYASRYWELYNEIGGNNERVTASTFRMGLPKDSGLRESLTKKPPEGMRQLMRRIEEYKRLKDYRLQSKGKTPMMNCLRQTGFPFRSRGGLTIQELIAQMREVNVTFKKPVHRILDQIKNEPYFQWLNKMGGDPSRRNQNLYCTYHRDKGHTTEQCQVLKDHLGQLIKVGHLKDLVLDSGDRVAGQDTRQKGNPLPPPVRVIEVIHVAPKKLIAGRRKGMLIVVLVEGNPNVQSLGKKMKFAREPIKFDDDDLEGTIQPHDDALVVMARISGFLVKRVMVDQGCGVNIMYLDLFKGLDQGKRT